MAQMMVHPFEIKPSGASGAPDELMITWGNTPQDSVASMYLPEVASSGIIALANKVHGTHRITAVDAHTIQFPSGDVTLVPVPAGEGRYAGLLGVDLPSTARQGDKYTVAVRQFTQVTATLEPPPPPPPQPQIAAEPGASRVRASVVAAAARRESFSWRQLVGAFEFTLTVSANGEVLYPQERLLAWLRWRVGVTPSSSRWIPVLLRYLNLTELLVSQLGGDPARIPPSQVGDVPQKVPGWLEPPFALGDTCEWTGKVEAIHYDQFGDFSGFTILSEHGRQRRFRGREDKIEQLVRHAWTERTVVSILVHEHDPDWPVTVILRRYH